VAFNHANQKSQHVIKWNSLSQQLERLPLRIDHHLRLFPFGDVVKAIDCSNDFSPIILQRTNIDDDSDLRAVRPLDEHFTVINFGYFPHDHLGHGTLFVGHETAVRLEHFERAAKPLVRISQRWFASPQFGGVTVEVQNYARVPHSRATLPLPAVAR
jgi:hypothetical protein